MTDDFLLPVKGPRRLAVHCRMQRRRAWCSKLFQRGPAQRPGQRLMCSAECRLDARRDVHARHMAKVRAAQPKPDTTVCEVCGYEAMNRGGLASHRWAAHGLRMGAA